MKLTPFRHQHLEPLAFTPEEASQVSRIGLTALYAAIQRGELRARKITPRKFLIMRRDLIAWLESFESTVPESADAGAQANAAA